MILLNLCLTDLPKENIIKGKNGKLYINIVVDERKEVGKFGDTHTVTLSQSKEERDAKQDKVYVGSGKEIIFENRDKPQHTPTISTPDSDPEEMPF